MSLSILVTAALLGQSAFSLAVDKPAIDTSDVAYAELQAGRSHAAVTKLEASDEARAGDPAVLINLGAAYAGAGMPDKALASYRAAIASPVRYDLELADGSWEDSRVVARKALKGMLAANTLASR